MDCMGVERLCAQGLHLKMFLELQKWLQENWGILDEALKWKTGFQYSFVDWEVYRIVLIVPCFF